MKVLSCVVIVLLSTLASSLATLETIGEIKAKFGLGGHVGTGGAYNGGYGRNYAGGYGGGYGSNYAGGYGGGYGSSYAGGYGRNYAGGYGGGYGSNYASGYGSNYASGTYGRTYAPVYAASGYTVSPNVGYSSVSTGQQVSAAAAGGYGYQQAQNNQQGYRIIQVIVPNSYASGYTSGYSGGGAFNYGQTASSSVASVQQPQVLQQQNPVLVPLPQQQQQIVNNVPVAPITTNQIATPIISQAPQVQFAAQPVVQNYVPIAGVRTSQSIASSSAYNGQNFAGSSNQYGRASLSSPSVSVVRLIYANVGDNEKQYSSSASGSYGQPSAVYGTPSVADYRATSSYDVTKSC